MLDDLPAAAAVLTRMWKYPPEYGRAILETLRIVADELNDPKKREAAVEEARKLGLYLDRN